jgi:hypothetical protein
LRAALWFFLLPVTSRGEKIKKLALKAEEGPLDIPPNVKAGETAKDTGNQQPGHDRFIILKRLI